MDEFRVEQQPGARAIRVTGEVDLATVEALRTSLKEASLAGGPIVVDMRDLAFIDSSGIHALADAATELGERNWCLFIHTHDGPVRRMFEIAGADRMPSIHVIYHEPPASQ
jgi:anti-sigma B factor antagonist